MQSWSFSASDSVQANYSFSGALFDGSKIILCAVTMRGRHRSLPMSLDRAIMLPHEFDKKEKEEDPLCDASIAAEASLPK